MINGLLPGVTAVAIASIAMPVAVAQTTVAVNYWKRPCGMPGELAVEAPVTVGTLELRRGAHAPITVTLGQTPVSVTVPGSGPLNATLRLETARIRMVLSGNLAVERIFLKPSGLQSGNETFSIELKEADHNGSVNALMTLERAAEFAEQANGGPLPKLTARIFNNPSSLPAEVTHFDEPAAVNIVGVAGRDDRWEPTPLIHEYGHFVMHQLAPGGPWGGDHYTERSYPERPDLAWTEGFASAFAGVVTKPEWSGRLFKRCGPYMSLVAPTRPVLAQEHARYAQYNETRVAAATYELIEHLGGGVPGFRRLLDGMKAYKRDGHSAHTARDLRDLAVQEFERTAADHAAISLIFHMQGMSWRQGFHLGVTGDEDHGEFNDKEITLSVTGPGGFECRATSDINTERVRPTVLDSGGTALGKKVTDGGLNYSVDDDCYLKSGDGVAGNGRKPHTFGIDRVDIPFPYLSGLAHWTGQYTVNAKFVCKTKPVSFRARCPDTYTVQLAFSNLWLLFNEPSLRRPIPVTLVNGVDMQIVTFKANGDCTAIGGVNCGF